MPLNTEASANAGNAAQAKHSGRNDCELAYGESAMTPTAAMASDGRNRQRQPPAAVNETAQQREFLVLGVFRNKALRRGAESKIALATDQEQPGPGIHVNAELELAKPARQHDLRQKGEQRRNDAENERGAGQSPHQR